MTHDPVDLLSQQIGQLERSLTQRLSQQDRTLEDIRRQTKETNGRVSELEAARERAEGRISVFRWIPTAIAGALGSALVTGVLAATGSLH